MKKFLLSWKLIIFAFISFIAEICNKTRLLRILAVKKKKQKLKKQDPLPFFFRLWIPYDSRQLGGIKKIRSRGLTQKHYESSHCRSDKSYKCNYEIMKYNLTIEGFCQKNPAFFFSFSSDPPNWRESYKHSDVHYALT